VGSSPSDAALNVAEGVFARRQNQNTYRKVQSLSRTEALLDADADRADLEFRLVELLLKDPLYAPVPVAGYLRDPA
jgi:hypothetical protein